LQRLARFVLVVFAAGALVAATTALVAPQVGAVLAAHEAAPIKAIDLDPLAQRSIVLDSEGRQLAALHGEQNRANIPLADVPRHVVDAVLAVEDEDFYQHGGLNVRALTRALFTNVKAGDVRQGGSTITQQLVKNALLDADQNLDRKVREAVLAVRLEDQLSKDEILERYLNTVYLGNGAYGLQAAAETYFGIGATELDVAQVALLAGLIKNPVGYDPFTQPEASERRRAEVVRRLVQVGQIDEDEADAIRETPLPTERQTVLPKPNDYFVNDVIRRLLDDRRLGATQSDRYNLLFKGGLTIKTTLDLQMQYQAVSALAETIPDTGGRFTSSLVAIEPSTGAVRALVGGSGFEQAKFNIATQGPGRQAGSAFKSFVLAAAIEDGISPTSTINGAGPCRFPNPGGTPDPYEVENFEGGRGGVTDLFEATKRSYNCSFVRLGLVVGIEKAMAMAERAGITTDLGRFISSPLGTNEVRPLDMASAYGTFANHGEWVEPHLVTEVLDSDGEVIFRHEPDRRRAMSPDTAHTMAEVLRQNVQAGTGTRARFPDGRPAAGKTGTTQEYSDAWFVGFTPQLATAVWMGAPEGKVPMLNVGGLRRVTGGSFPAQAWQAFMGPAMAEMEVVAFPPPPRYGPSQSLRVEGEREIRPERPRRRTTTTAPPSRGPDRDDDGGGGGDEPSPPSDGGGRGNGNGNGNGGGGGDDDDATATTETSTTETSAAGQTDGSG
jgi:1A family penicillin-binding protein